ncbi:Putative NADPH-dependent methylglyoxal reductase GRP2 [Leucoagaricus sp. SymC.cos]|nr:Putative NADPH-dependent methylglyoxal reductase GRP2 [Leucoagaricus sp. SymC.cos]
MTIAPSPAKVLVTGASGFIAIWVVRTLLEQGYSVRGAVRSASKGKYLQDYFGERGFGHDKLEIVVVDDMTKVRRAFDEAVKGVDAIEHVASPVALEAVDPQDFIKPAVEGTLSILRSALKNGSSLKRIVITSSGAAIMVQPTEPRLFSEEDWNTASVEDVKMNGKNANPTSGYRASKTLAERAAWDFFAENKSKTNWDLVVLNPPVVVGPPIHEVSGGPTNLNASEKWLYDVLVNSSSQSKELLYKSSCWVDVRDMALAHVLALQKEAACGERIVLTVETDTFIPSVDVARTLKPYPLPNHSPPEGMPGQEKKYLIHFKTEKQEQILGMTKATLRSMETMVRDTLQEFARRGW